MSQVQCGDQTAYGWGSLELEVAEVGHDNSVFQVRLVARAEAEFEASRSVLTALIVALPLEQDVVQLKLRVYDALVNVGEADVVHVVVRHLGTHEPRLEHVDRQREEALGGQRREHHSLDTTVGHVGQ